MPTFTIETDADGFLVCNKSKREVHIIAEIYCDGDTCYIEEAQCLVPALGEGAYREFTADIEKRTDIKERLHEYAEECFRNSVNSRCDNRDFDRWQDR